MTDTIEDSIAYYYDFWFKNFEPDVSKIKEKLLDTCYDKLINEQDKKKCLCKSIELFDDIYFSFYSSVSSDLEKFTQREDIEKGMEYLEKIKRAHKKDIYQLKKIFNDWITENTKRLNWLKDVTGPGDYFFNQERRKFHKQNEEFMEVDLATRGCSYPYGK